MKPANDIARAFLLGGRSHLCSGAGCDCVCVLARLIETARLEGERRAAHRANKLRLAKPRIAEALEEIRKRRGA